MANPLAVILEQARVWIIDPTAPTAAEAAGGAARLIPAALIFVGACVLGWRVFNRQAPRIAEALVAARGCSGDAPAGAAPSVEFLSLSARKSTLTSRLARARGDARPPNTARRG